MGKFLIALLLILLFSGAGWVGYSQGYTAPGYTGGGALILILLLLLLYRHKEE